MWGVFFSMGLGSLFLEQTSPSTLIGSHVLCRALLVSVFAVLKLMYQGVVVVCFWWGVLSGKVRKDWMKWVL